MIFYLLVSFGFVIGIVLMVSPEAFNSFSEALKKEYGVKKRIIPKIENTMTSIMDDLCKKHAVIIGMFISVASFALLIICR